MSRLRSIALLFLAVAAIGLLRAADDAPRLHFDRIDLTDGRKLKDVVVKSYDAKSERLLVIASGKAMLIRLELIPEQLRDQLKSDAPPSGSTSSEVPAPQPTEAPPLPRVAPPQRQGNAGGDDATLQPALASHQRAALQRAKTFYRFEFRAGSDAITVTALNFETDEPQAVSGWPGRYRTEGRVFLEFFDSKGRSFNRTTDRFEVTTEQQPGHAIKVIDFTRKT